MIRGVREGCWSSIEGCKGSSFGYFDLDPGNRCSRANNATIYTNYSIDIHDPPL